MFNKYGAFSYAKFKRKRKQKKTKGQDKRGKSTDTAVSRKWTRLNVTYIHIKNTNYADNTKKPGWKKEFEDTKE